MAKKVAKKTAVKRTKKGTAARRIKSAALKLSKSATPKK